MISLMRKSPLWQRGLFAVFVLAIAAALRFALFDTLGRGSPYVTYYPAVMLVSLLAGRFAGVLSILLSVSLSFLWTLQGHITRIDGLIMLFFVVSCLLITFICEILHDAQTEAQEAQRAEEAVQRLRAVAAEQEKALALSNQLVAIVESSDDAIIGKNLDSVITSWNKGATKIFGYTQAEALGMSIMRLIPPDRQDDEQHIMERILRGESVEHFETLRQRKDGTLINVSVTASPIRAADGTVIGVSKVARDITTRKQVEESQISANRVLAQATQRLRQTLVTAHMVWWEWNIKTGALHIDPCGAPCILGYQSQDLKGMNFDTWLDWMPAEDQAEVRRTLAKTLAGENDEWTCEYRWRGPTGAYRWLRDIGRVTLRDPEGKPLLMAGSTQEVQRIHEESDRVRQLETDLLHAQRVDMLGQYTGGIAHDFNNLLTGISGNLQLAMQSLPSGHELLEYLGPAKRGCERATALVQRLLQSANRRTGTSLRPTRLHALVREISPLIRASIPRTIQLVLDLSDCPEIPADEAQLLQIILNLSINAAHAIGTAPGSITISLRPDAPGPNQRLERIRLAVADTGCGMDEATRARIFEPFYTTKASGQGTGLGLAVVLAAVKAHGGTITCLSQPGRGSVFEVLLPITPVPETEGPPAARRLPKERIRGRRVLVLDDERVIVDVLGAALRHDGHEASLFTAPREALQALREHRERFDLVISDLSMPEMNGVDFVRALRQLRGDLPVILISGDFGRLRTDEDLSGFDRLMMLNKPLDLSTFLEALHQILAEEAVSPLGRPRDATGQSQAAPESRG